jgi:predicted ATPase/class 3 adenylate cyclase
MSLPTGTVTFLRSDVEGSMAHLRTLGPRWDAVNDRHLSIIRDAVDGHGGAMVRTEGDAAFAAFPEAAAAVRAAIAAQRAIDTEPWPPESTITVRMGLHSGEAHLAGDDYGGWDVNRAARIAAVGHGGQVVASEATAVLITSALADEVALRDLGRHALKDIPTPEHIFQVDAPGRRTAFPPLRVASVVPGNLPDRLTSFVGRTADLDELDALLERARLVTLTGPGGIGKTSLAVELARRRSAAVPDGAWFVALETLTDPTDVAATIARTLGLHDGAERSAADALPGYLATRSTLLVLDNFEQILDAAPIVVGLLRDSPGTRIVVASRAALHVGGEQEYPVRPLTDHRADAGVRLFIERGRAARPDWDPEPDLAVVAETCAMLDGLPLGIELGAARLSVLPPTAIRDRLKARLPLPGSGPRDAPARQRTLDAAIGWSHDLLAPEVRSVLHAVGIFEGGFDLAQAEHVLAADSGSDVLEALMTLADLGLLARDATTAGVDAARLEGSGIRFTMLRTVAAYALARLAEDGGEAALRRRHAEAFTALTEAAAVHYLGRAQPAWLDRLSLDLANIRAAMRWAIATDETDIAMRLLAALWRFWLVMGQLDEGVEMVSAVFAMPGADSPTIHRAWALGAAGSIAYWQARPADAHRLYGEQLTAATALDDQPAIADASFNWASSSFIEGDSAKAIEALLRAREIYRDLGDERGVNRCDWCLCNILMFGGETEAAGAELRKIIDRAEELDDPAYVGLAAATFAWVIFHSGDTPLAIPWVLRAMMEAYALRDNASTTLSFAAGAVGLLAMGKAAQAATVMGAFDALCERYGVKPPMSIAELIGTADPTEHARQMLPQAEFDAAWARGSRLSLGEAVDLLAGELGPQ